MRIYAFTLIAALLCSPVFSQSKCGTDVLQEFLMQDSDYVKWFNQNQQEVMSKVDLTKVVTCSSPLVIPVAVHYNGNITSTNVTCLVNKALEQVQVLNEDFGAYNSDITNYCTISAACCLDYPPDVISQGSCLQFCLASDNHPTGETIYGGYAITIGDYIWSGGIDAPNWAGYLNLFVSDVSPAGFGGALGVAPLSGGTDPDGNGVYILAAAFGGAGGGCTSGTGIDTNGTYNLGRTGTHEVGHFYGLPHVFDGCGAGDGVGDTPPQDSPNFGCPSVNTSTCTSNSGNTCGTPDFWFNFMDYVDDDCMYMFTEGQSQVMYNTALVAGTSGNEPYKDNTSVCDGASQPAYVPTYPTGCPGGATIPESAFSPTSGTLSLCAGETIDFMDLSTGCSLTGWNWTFSGAGVSPTTSTDQNPTVTVTSTGTLTVTLTTSGAGGPDPTPANGSISVTILGPDDPACSDCGEFFTDTGGPGARYQNNENIDWTFCAPPGQFVTVGFTFFNVEAGCNDALTVYDGPTTSSPNLGSFCGNGVSFAPGGGSISSSGQCLTFNFSSNGSVRRPGWEADVVCAILPVELLSFEVRKTNDKVNLYWSTATEVNNEGFEIQRSLDGTVFEKIGWVEGNGNTDGIKEYQFIDHNINHAGNFYYRLKQMDYNGSFDYSDIVSVRIDVANISLHDFSLFPNPNKGVFNLTGNTNDEHVKFDVLDKSGRLVYTLNGSLDNGQKQLDLSFLENGVYTLRIVDRQISKYKSFVILK